MILISVLNHQRRRTTMRVKKEVEILVNEFRTVPKDSERFKEISNIFKKQYKMNVFEQLALFYTPPVVEWDFDNRDLLFEKEKNNNE
jgi:hypothetical protein